VILSNLIKGNDVVTSLDDDSLEPGEAEIATPKAKRPRKKKAAVKTPAASAKTKGKGKSTAAKKPAKTPVDEVPAATPEKRFTFSAVDAAVNGAESALEISEKVMVKFEAAAERAIKGLEKADDTLIARRQAARDRGTQAAKNALKRAQEGKAKAADGLRHAKAQLREAKASYSSMVADLNRLRRAEQRLLKSALLDESKLLKKLVAEEKRVLSSMHESKPKKRRKRRTKAEMAAARAVEAGAAVTGSEDVDSEAVE
jgi:hypothetical protein